MPPKAEQSKGKQPVTTRRSARLAKKRRSNKPEEDRQALQQDVEEPEVNAEPLSEDEAPLAGKSYYIFGLGMCERIKDLLQLRPVEPWETYFFELPFLSAPSSRSKVCLRHVLHSWFPERLTWIQYGQKHMYHGPIALKLIRRYIRTKAEGQRRALKEHRT
ncbi:hypothetical protein EAF00_003051 [Botryotinia globosa]|nr:hypothetical protein EAF00_003051 [Botryotinia globosa]